MMTCILESIVGYQITRYLEVITEDDWDKIWVLMIKYELGSDLVEQWGKFKDPC